MVDKAKVELVVGQLVDAREAGPSGRPVTRRLACKRIAVSRIRSLIPDKYIEALEQNQLLHSCCRHPENHELEAFYSRDEEWERKMPDIFIFHCTCGRQHRRFCVGGGDVRPFWEMDGG